ncbi:unnamed protein product [Blepharisma stoltei]|uniref:Uncharacterized protein n=1 Tax=Blepharisma stoltei TaxID=1481888 RepID=A0AAU9IJA9_9CILI|nr:unnamed protein product [Blepharisma stoltei]
MHISLKWAACSQQIVDFKAGRKFSLNILKKLRSQNIRVPDNYSITEIFNLILQVKCSRILYHIQTKHWKQKNSGKLRERDQY